MSFTIHFDFSCVYQFLIPLKEFRANTTMCCSLLLRSFQACQFYLLTVLKDLSDKKSETASCNSKHLGAGWKLTFRLSGKRQNVKTEPGFSILFWCFGLGSHNWVNQQLVCGWPGKYDSPFCQTDQSAAVGRYLWDSV